MVLKSAMGLTEEPARKEDKKSKILFHLAKKHLNGTYKISVSVFFQI
jgi:hypothetical protein